MFPQENRRVVVQTNKPKKLVEVGTPVKGRRGVNCGTLIFQQRLERAEGRQSVEGNKVRYAYLPGAGYSREEWDLMWLCSAKTPWAHPFSV